MNTHEKYAALLDPYLDGELDGEAAARLEAHLASCPECAAYVADVLDIRAAFPAPEEAPEGFAERVLASLPEREQAPERKSTAGKRLVWRRAVLPLAACLAVLAGNLLSGRFAGGGFPGSAGTAQNATASSTVDTSGFPGSASSGSPSSSSSSSGSSFSSVFGAEAPDAYEKQAPEHAAEPSERGDTGAAYTEEAGEESYDAASAPRQPSGESADSAGASRGGEDSLVTAAVPETDGKLRMTGDPEDPAESEASTALTSPPAARDAALILPSSAAALLAEFAPVEMTEEGAWYALTEAEFSSLAAALAESTEDAAGGGSTDGAAANPVADSGTVYVLLEMAQE